MSTVLSIGKQLLDVMAAAHAKDIIHRDIKPANLFITKDGTLKVLDFGIARVRDAVVGDAAATGAGTLLGTPSFMPPEQAIGKAGDIDARTDVWSVGATLFTLLSGRCVHEGQTAHHVLVLAATARAPSLASVAPDAPPGLVAVIDRALAFDRNERWVSAAAMRDALGSSDYLGVDARSALARLVTTDRVASSPSFALDPTTATGPSNELSSEAAMRLAGARAVSIGAGASRIVGGTTAQPTASAAIRTERSRTTTLVAAALGIMFAIGCVLSVISLAATAKRRAHAKETAPSASMPLVVGASNTTPEIASTPPAPVLAPIETAAAASASSPPAPTAKVSPPSTVAPVPKASATARKPDCRSPFTIDAEGNKVFKKECL